MHTAPEGCTPAAAAKTTASVCCYCGTGCGVLIRSQGQRILSVEGDPAHPSSQGRLCSKGRTLAETVRRDGQSRVLHAQWRAGKDQPLSDIALEDALDIAAGKLAETIMEHGPDAVGFYLSGQLLTEDYAVFNKLARALVGTNNIDTNSRLCMSSAVAGYKLTLGADAPPACYDDLDHADTVLIAGSNMAYTHPVLFRRLEAAKAGRPDMKIVVVDPRRSETCSLADLHLAIAPGSDVALFHAMLNVMVWDGLIDRDYIERHTEGFDALKQRIHEFTPRAAQDVCGIPAADIVRCAHWFGTAKAALSLYTMGLNQSSSGTAKNAALIHLHLATGQIGRPGAGPFSLTGQPNAMGGREAGGMATLLPGHRDPADATHRAEAARLWRVDSLPAAPGLTALDMFDAVLQGKIRVLWIGATNPAQSMPDQAKVRAALRKAELVIVQEAFADTETLAYADLVLPAATWPEKSGTVTNSERRISRVRAAMEPPGDAQADWKLACAVARKLADRIAPPKRMLFDYLDEARIFDEHARFTKDRDLDYSALNHAVLDASGPQQWPYRVPTRGPVRLYADGVFPTPSGRARFFDTGYAPVAESVSAHYPLRLTTGRLRDHWHTLSRTGLVPALTRHVEEPFVHLHPEDMRRYKIQDGALVKIRTRRGHLIVPAQDDPGLKPGHAFLPMHWGSGFIAGDGVNALTSGARDPISHQPELKHSAAGVEALQYAWHAGAWVQGSYPVLRRQLASWLHRFPYAVLVPTAIGGEGVRLRLASPGPPSPAILTQLAGDLGLDSADLAFDDPARGVLRRILRLDGRIKAYLLAGDIRAGEALLHWADTGQAPANVGHALMGRSGPVVRARIVCSCAGVSAAAIQSAIDAGENLEQMKASLQCGVGCGSCLPQIKSMIQDANLKELQA
ncbi:nitrate reductase [Pollutimonas sp. M17]|uniref:nitrate reductase n=1 Tax=Pollutimonas sp. M17 TaxID=2962065 RepID=UPI0021F3F413|nr:nitrate reductase [Pollutimonas sp. M17]UYO93772.1 molybdopterin-dependent oxidoreductase [Pollutimonas sp. M17]